MWQTSWEDLKLSWYTSIFQKLAHHVNGSFQYQKLLFTDLSFKCLITEREMVLVLLDNWRSDKPISRCYLWFLKCTTSYCKWGSRDGHKAKQEISISRKIGFLGIGEEFFPIMQYNLDTDFPSLFAVVKFRFLRNLLISSLQMELSCDAIWITSFKMMTIINFRRVCVYLCPHSHLYTYVCTYVLYVLT